MRLSPGRRRNAVVGAVTLLAATLGLAAPAAAFGFGFGNSGPRNIHCDVGLHALIPQPAPTAANVGIVNCDVFGNGRQTDSSVTTRTGPLTGSFTGPFTMTFRFGSISGRFLISFVTTVAGPPLHITGVDYTGTLQVTSGTGAYRNVRGSGVLTGHSDDAVDTILSEDLVLSGF